MSLFNFLVSIFFSPTEEEYPNFYSTPPSPSPWAKVTLALLKNLGLKLNKSSPLPTSASVGSEWAYSLNQSN